MYTEQKSAATTPLRDKYTEKKSTAITLLWICTQNILVQLTHYCRYVHRTEEYTAIQLENYTQNGIVQLPYY